MLFCIMLPNFILIGPPTVEIWILHPVTYLLMSLPSEVEKFISKPNFVDISNDGWDITNIRHNIGILLPVSTWTISRNLLVNLHQATEIRPNRRLIAEMWSHIHFSRWRPRPLNTTSAFVFVDVTASEGQSLSANIISLTYINSLLRYDYFRFW